MQTQDKMMRPAEEKKIPCPACKGECTILTDGKRAFCKACGGTGKAGGYKTK